MQPAPETPLLEVQNLKTYFYTEDGVVKAADGVSFRLDPGKVLGLVGESGCGKTVTALSIMRLVPPPGRVVNGVVRFHGEDLLALPDHEMRDLRGSRISMIFQQPQSSLNPVYTTGFQLAEVFEIHTGISEEQRWQRAVELLRSVGIPDPDQKAHTYPYEVSGGQAQRVMIAMALALNPEILIADEPTTALDVTIQAQILDLLRNLCQQLGTTILLITHDLGVIAEIADRVAVMYAGKIVEQAGVVELFDEPKHPYTQGLIESTPVLGEVKRHLHVIPGIVPNLIDLPPGCRFAPRCQVHFDKKMAICEQEEPPEFALTDDHQVFCWLYQE